MGCIEERRIDRGEKIRERGKRRKREGERREYRLADTVESAPFFSRMHARVPTRHVHAISVPY